MLNRKERLKAPKKVCEEHFNNVFIDSTQTEGVKQTDSLKNYNFIDSVLTPTCAKLSSPSDESVSSHINLSDFESDNSSPFDNMELKTINDMEVLASILSANNMEQSLNNNNSIIDKDVGKNCLVLNNKISEWGCMPLNGYNNITYSNLDYNNSVLSSHHKDFNQFGFYPNSEHNQISNYGLNDFSNQFEVAVALDQGSTNASKPEPKILGEKVKKKKNFNKFKKLKKFFFGI